ncbi:MAG TPA: SDR family oxidoreductase, partial [Steroidobacteraceae bacterium]|nr:SDR family oxidoreductase [Steroidobacteraceae bacterium]
MRHSMHPDLSSQYIFVSGAGRGLGRSVARHLARCGAVVGVSDIDVASCNETAQLVRDAGGQAHAFPGDLGRRATFLEAAAAFAKVGGRMDAVVNNAAHLRYEKVDDVTEETFEKMVNIGLKAVVWGTQALLAHYDPARGGAIVNMASPVAYRGYPNTTIYSSIKSAIVGLTHTLAAELGPRNVRVNAVAPGSVPTPGALQYVDAVEYERRARTIPLRRLGAEVDNDNAIAFLLSKEASFITG